MQSLFVYSDGGSSNNPGPAGIGVIIKLKTADENRKTIHQISKYIGKATNNQAEYAALIEALEAVKKLKSEEVKEIKVFLDSELIVNQLNLQYKIKNSKLQPLFLKAHNLAVSLGRVKFIHIPREQNQEADRLVKKAIKSRCTVK